MTKDFSYQLDLTRDIARAAQQVRRVTALSAMSPERGDSEKAAAEAHRVVDQLAACYPELAQEDLASYLADVYHRERLREREELEELVVRRSWLPVDGHGQVWDELTAAGVVDNENSWVNKGVSMIVNDDLFVGATLPAEWSIQLHDTDTGSYAVLVDRDNTERAEVFYTATWDERCAWMQPPRTGPANDISS
ncbi:hypothetical protein AB0C34_17225 [Nocardia sp. NPDC049220]|uniref:hypothetical protein n=1 Tax=Nocardia sp. NPDC049220 TaxID=3155273 RepID=UPI0033ED4E74